MKMIKSLELSPIEIAGKIVRRHYAHYYNDAPFPFWSIEVREVAHYTDIDPFPYKDVLAAVKFSVITDKNIVHEVPGGLPLRGAEGLKHKSGEIYLKYDEQNGRFVLFSIVNIIPQIDLLPTIAAPYIEKAVVATFRGILGI
ncbi:MAG: hypothetical protein HQK53_06910 [Oligoflexia bacterium]|nr:hypothetical protein [Oligoflexia bacterium]